MKVINEPSAREWTTQCSCRRCHTTVQLDPGDLKSWDDQREGLSFEWGCPTCGDRNFLQGDEVPKDVRWKIKSARH